MLGERAVWYEWSYGRRLTTGHVSAHIRTMKKFRSSSGSGGGGSSSSRRGSSRSSDKSSRGDPLKRPDVAQRAALAKVRAAAMGLVPPGEALEGHDMDSLRRTLMYVQRAGIGQALVKEAAVEYDADRLGTLLDELQEALEQSPVPSSEWPAMERVFDADSLARLVGISISSLRRYASGARQTPDDVAARLHFLALVVGDLAGSYNDIGIRRWFRRDRAQLGDVAPVDLLTGAWDPEGSDPSRVRKLAASLLASPAT